MGIEHYDKPLIQASAYGPQYTAPDGTVFYPSCSLGSLIVPMTTTQWTAFTVSTTGAPSINNTIEDGFRMTLTTTGATAALIRQYAAMTFNRNWLPGKNSEIDWSKPFRVRIPLRVTIGGNGLGFRYTLLIGGLSAAPTGHTPIGKGLSINVEGIAAGEGAVSLGAHDGTSYGESDNLAFTANGTLVHLDLWFLPDTLGAVLMLNGAVVGSIPVGEIPAGVSTSAQGWAALMEHTTDTAGSSFVQQHPFIVDFLAP